MGGQTETDLAADMTRINPHNNASTHESPMDKTETARRRGPLYLCLCLCLCLYLCLYLCPGLSCKESEFCWAGLITFSVGWRLAGSGFGTMLGEGGGETGPSDECDVDGVSADV